MYLAKILTQIFNVFAILRSVLTALMGARKYSDPGASTIEKLYRREAQYQRCLL
jgi:hypothetical protein